MMNKVGKSSGKDKCILLLFCQQNKHEILLLILKKQIKYGKSTVLL